MLRFFNHLLQSQPEKIVSVSILLGLGWWFFSLAHYIPQMADDYCLSMPSFSAGITELHRIYFNWSGRMFSHGSIMAANALPELGRDIINLLMFLSLGLVLVLFVVPWKEVLNQPLLLVAAFGMILASAPALGEILWWLSGAATYLWSSVFMLLWLIPYARWLQQQPLIQHPEIWGMGFVVMGFLSGNTNENTAPAAFILAILWCGWRYSQTRERPPLVLMLGLIGQLAGTLALLLAPGNITRLQQIEGQGDGPSLFMRMLALLEDIHVHAYLICPVVLVGVVLLILALKTQKIRENNASLILVLGSFLAAGLSYGALMFAPYVEPRAMTGPMIFMAIGCMGLLHLFLIKTQSHLWPRAICLALGALGILMMGKALARYELPLFITELQTKEIALCQANPSTEACQVTRYPVGRDFVQILSNFAQPTRNAQDWGNQCWAKAKGISGIVGVDRTFRAP